MRWPAGMLGWGTRARLDSPRIEELPDGTLLIAWGGPDERLLYDVEIRRSGHSRSRLCFVLTAAPAWGLSVAPHKNGLVPGDAIAVRARVAGTDYACWSHWARHTIRVGR